MYKGPERSIWHCLYPKHPFRTLEIPHSLVFKVQKRRYNEIKAFFGDISQGSLTKQLRELETDGLTNRKIYPEVPPRVEYSLTSKGEEFIPIIDLMEAFGKKFGEQVD